MDTHAYNPLSRSTLLVALDNEDRDSDRRYVAASKRNLAKRSPVLEFSIAEKTVIPRKVPIGVPVVVGLNPSEKAASELLTKRSSSTKAEHALTLCAPCWPMAAAPAMRSRRCSNPPGHRPRTIQRAASEIVGVIFENEDFPKRTLIRKSSVVRVHHRP